HPKLQFYPTRRSSDLQLRNTTLEILKNISERERNTIEQKLKRHLINSDLWKQATTIGITMTKGFEWRTKPIIEEAWRQGKQVCVPNCNPEERKLTLYQLQEYEQLEIVYYQLLEPKPEKTKKVEKSQIDLLIVPGIVFDEQGFRIGFGGGYYDRFLTDFPNENVSLVSTQQLLDHVPSESFDIPVNHLITVNGMFK